MSLATRVSDLAVRVAQQFAAIEPGPWQTLTLASANWTQTETAQWRYNGDRIELRGYCTRTTSTFTAGGTLFGFGSTNPPNPGRVIRLVDLALIAAATPDATVVQWYVDTGAGTFRSTTATHAVEVGDGVSLNQISWPI